MNQFFQSIEAPSQNELFASGDHYLLFRMLVDLGFRPPSDAQEAVHLNAFVLIRRGFKSEEISGSEYEKLRGLLEGTVETDRDDMELQDFGDHRTLYQYLTEGLGIYVEPGRGPVWHRAQQLVNQFERTPETE